MYNYVDPTGSLVTVNYKAGPEGFTQERSVEAGAVVMRNVPGEYSSLQPTISSPIGSSSFYGDRRTFPRPTVGRSSGYSGNIASRFGY